MKKLLSIFLIAIVVLNLAFVSPADARRRGARAMTGEQVFKNNCVACHAGGNNRVVAAKTLKKDALAKYHKDTKDAIMKQVTYGKGAMPAFKRLGKQNIANVADYVLEQAEKGWK